MVWGLAVEPPLSRPGRPGRPAVFGQTRGCVSTPLAMFNEAVVFLMLFVFTPNLGEVIQFD